ncbi:MAG: glycosyl hydrolase [Acidobacteriota bacterium]
MRTPSEAPDSRIVWDHGPSTAGRCRTPVLCLMALLLPCGAFGAEATSTTIKPPPAGKLYHGVYPGGQTGEEDDLTPADLASYEQTVQKTAAWVYFSNNWYADRRFPLATARWIRDAGSVPFIRLMLRDSPEQNRPNRIFTLERILQGKFDKNLRAWGRAARDFGTPLLVEYGTEVNGEWFPWNGKWNGGGKTGAYGDPKYPDGPERFRDAYRHIIDVVRRQGATNITWVFHVNGDDWPQTRWNRFENYYPGDSYVDWLGVSAYGAQTPTDDWCDAFAAMLDAAYPRLAALSATKPIAVLEFGVTARNPICGQAAWAEAALTNLVGLRWPRVIAFSWWNEYWQNDDNPAHDTNMRVQDNPALAGVFQRLVGANDDVLGRLILTCKPGGLRLGRQPFWTGWSTTMWSSRCPVF